MRKLDYEFIFTCGIVAFIAALGMVAGIVDANIQMCKRGSTVYYSYAFANFVRNTRCRYLLF